LLNQKNYILEAKRIKTVEIYEIKEKMLDLKYRMIQSTRGELKKVTILA